MNQLKGLALSHLVRDSRYTRYSLALIGDPETDVNFIHEGLMTWEYATDAIALEALMKRPDTRHTPRMIRAQIPDLIYHGHLDCMEVLLRLYPEVANIKFYGGTLLEHIISCNSIEAARILLNTPGIDVNLNFPIHSAIDNFREEILDMLLSVPGIDIGAPCDTYYSLGKLTPLDVACRYRASPNILKSLFECSKMQDFLPSAIRNSLEVNNPEAIMILVAGSIKHQAFHDAHIIEGLDQWRISRSVFRRKYDVPDIMGAKVMAFILMVSRGYFSSQSRFFLIAAKLPLELQMYLAHKVTDYHHLSFFSSGDISKALRILYREGLVK